MKPAAHIDHVRHTKCSG